MITPDNLTDLLAALDFQKTKTVWRKTIGAATVEIDFAKRQIAYPEAQGLIVNERQTCNFSASIADAQAVITVAPARKQAIMQRYL